MADEEFVALESQYIRAKARKASASGLYQKLRREGSTPSQLRLHRDKYLFCARELLNVEARYWCEADRRDTA